MKAANPSSSHVDGMLFWQCVCVCANPARYAPKAVERQFLERVIRAYRSGRRLRDTVQSSANGIIRACKERRASALRGEEALHGACAEKNPAL